MIYDSNWLKVPQKMPEVKVRYTFQGNIGVFNTTQAWEGVQGSLRESMNFNRNLLMLQQDTASNEQNMV